MNDEPITSRELIAAYRSQARPSAVARERMLRTISDPRRRAPIAAPPRRRAAVAWLALAAALALIGVSAYLLAGARHDAHVAPADMMMAPQLGPPGSDGVTTTREPGGDSTRGNSPLDPRPIVDPAGDSPHLVAPAGDSSHLVAPVGDSSYLVDADDDSPPLVDPAADAPRPVDSPASASSRSGDSAHPTAAPADRSLPAAAARPTRAGEPTGDQVLAELALIQSIKEALDADRPQEALTLVERHARSFPRGTLIEEREALRVVALCASDDPARGLRAQQGFLRSHPRSAYGDRVRGACPAQ